jgi:hypothetical protein
MSLVGHLIFKMDENRGGHIVRSPDGPDPRPRIHVDTVNDYCYSDHMDADWTLEELTAEVARQLQSLSLSMKNGQVADVPNSRVVRYYQTVGLLRRPHQRGRTAFYGPMHVVEIVAIKRLQARGLSLDEVRAMMFGKTDGQLRTLADLPEPLPKRPTIPNFWEQPPPRSVDASIFTDVPAPMPPADVSRLEVWHHPAGFGLVLPAHVASDRMHDVMHQVHALLLSHHVLPASKEPQ